MDPAVNMTDGLTAAAYDHVQLVIDMTGNQLDFMNVNIMKACSDIKKPDQPSFRNVNVSLNH